VVPYGHARSHSSERPDGLARVVVSHSYGCFFLGGSLSRPLPEGLGVVLGLPPPFEPPLPCFVPVLPLKIPRFRGQSDYATR